jgi:hypothetical protein
MNTIGERVLVEVVNPVPALLFSPQRTQGNAEKKQNRSIDFNFPVS